MVILVSDFESEEINFGNEGFVRTFACPCCDANIPEHNIAGNCPVCNMRGFKDLKHFEEQKSMKRGYGFENSYS